MKKRTILPLILYQKGLAQPGKGPGWDGIRSYIEAREDQLISMAAAGGKGSKPTDRLESEQAITQLLEKGIRPLSFKAIYEDAGCSNCYERHDPRTVKKWVIDLPAWRSLPEDYRKKVSKPGRRKK